MILLRKLRNLRKLTIKPADFIHQIFIFVDAFISFFAVIMLTFGSYGSNCLMQFYILIVIFYLCQSLSHYLIIKIPKIDVQKQNLKIKRFITLISVIQVFYLLLTVIFWQKTSYHPIYCALCIEYHMSILVGIGLIIHFCITLGILITLIHTFVTRKYYLIALGGFQVQQRIALQRQETQRRIGLIQPDYSYPIDYTKKSNKYYEFQDVIQIQPSTSESKQDQICSICLNKRLKSQQNIIKTKCNHYYHRNCLQKWATVNSRCPDCRTQFDQIKKDQKNSLNKQNTNVNTIKQQQKKQQIDLNFNQLEIIQEEEQNESQQKRNQHNNFQEE